MLPRYCRYLLKRDNGSKTGVSAAISLRSSAAVYLSSVSTLSNTHPNHNACLKRQYTQPSVLQLPRCTFDYQVISSTLPTQQSIHIRGFAATSRGGSRRNQDPNMRVCQSIEELTHMAYEHKDSMSPRGMSAYWTLVSKLLKKSRFEKVQNIEQMNHQLEDILGYTLKDINSFGYRDLATVAIGLAKIVKNVSGNDGKRLPQYGSPQRVLHDLIVGEKEFIFKVLAEPSMFVLHKFDARHLSNLIYAYGLAEYVIKFNDGSTLFDVFAEEVISFNNLNEFWPQALSNIVWAYANVGVSNSQLFKKVADHIVGLDNLNDFWPQALKDLVWACATARESHPKVFEKIANHIVQLETLNKFIPQDISNTVWAFAIAGEPHPELFKRLADHIVRLDNLNGFWPQALSNTVWAFATLDEQHPKLFKKVADHIISLNNLDRYDSQALKDIVWAYATAEEKHPNMFKMIGDHIVGLDNFQLNKFEPQHLSNTVWAYATASESHPQLFKTLTNEAIKRQHEFNPQNIANFLWAYATNGQVDEHLFSSLVPSVKDNLDKCNAQNLANIAWAYSVANVDAPSVFNDEFLTACLNKEDEFILEQLRQLHQWRLLQEELKSDVSLPPTLKKRCYEAFISRVPRQSNFQDDVISSLSSMGLRPQEEVLLESGYRIDAVVEVNGKQVAVEVDGPSHFIGRSRELIGSTILKHRQVAALDGMQLVSIPYWEWDKLKKDNKKKEQYLWSSFGNIK